MIPHIPDALLPRSAGNEDGAPEVGGVLVRLADDGYTIGLRQGRIQVLCLVGIAVLVLTALALPWLQYVTVTLP